MVVLESCTGNSEMDWMSLNDLSSSVGFLVRVIGEMMLHKEKKPSRTKRLGV